jgi:hypothetical protein
MRSAIRTMNKKIIKNVQMKFRKTEAVYIYILHINPKCEV